MADPKVDEARSWMVKGRQDLDAAEWLLASPQALYGPVGFHCQQAAEKSLKAYLTLHEDPFDRTDSLTALVAICLKHDSGFENLRQAATTLTPYAVSTRYPGDMPEISMREASEAVSLAQFVWEFVKSRFPQGTNLS